MFVVQATCDEVKLHVWAALSFSYHSSSTHLVGKNLILWMQMEIHVIVI